MVLLQELSRLRGSFLKLDESQSIMREEMMRVFTDVDSLKKQQQEMEVEQLKIHRSLQKLESHELADISNSLKNIEKRVDELDEFSSTVKSVLSNGNVNNNEAEDEKYSLMVTEMQKLKNQVRRDSCPMWPDLAIFYALWQNLVHFDNVLKVFGNLLSVHFCIWQNFESGFGNWVNFGGNCIKWSSWYWTIISAI